jgi:cold shock CspA family protein
MTSPTLVARKSSGTITEFNPSLGTGFIQRQDTLERIFVSNCSLKKNAKKYAHDNSFEDEIFDFDIIESTEHGLEAINVAHRTLKCTVPNCQRLTAFTHRKALQEHIDSKHSLKEEKQVKTTSATKISPSKPKPPRRHTVNLLAHSPATIGRFIGKQGANLKPIETKYRVKVSIVTKPRPKSFVLSSSPYLQVQIRSIDDLPVADLDKVTEKLKKAWQRAIREQEDHVSHRESQRTNVGSNYIEFIQLERVMFVKKKFQQKRWRLTQLRSTSSQFAVSRDIGVLW